MTPLPKPAEGQPCNGCGLCCIREVCSIGVKIYGPQVQAPCPGLHAQDGRYWCKVVLAERQAALPPIVATMLDIGGGCDSIDDVPPLTATELPS